jgi:hypothetical protein
MTLVALVFLLSAADAPATKPAEQKPAALKAVSAELKIRVIYAHSKTKVHDPKLADLEGSLKSLAYTAYELKAENTALKVTVGGEAQTYVTPFGRHLVISGLAHKKKGDVDQMSIQLEIPELKFKTKAWISEGATLVIGGPKYEDGVLLFAVGAAAIKN